MKKMTINNQCNKFPYEKAIEVLAPIFRDKPKAVPYSDVMKCFQGLVESLVKKVNGYEN